MRSQHYFAHLFSSGPVPAGHSVVVVIGSRTFDITRANDEVVPAVMEFEVAVPRLNLPDGRCRAFAKKGDQVTAIAGSRASSDQSSRSYMRDRSTFGPPGCWDPSAFLQLDAATKAGADEGKGMFLQRWAEAGNDKLISAPHRRTED